MMDVDILEKLKQERGEPNDMTPQFELEETEDP